MNKPLTLTFLFKDNANNSVYSTPDKVNIVKTNDGNFQILMHETFFDEERYTAFLGTIAELLAKYFKEQPLDIHVLVPYNIGTSMAIHIHDFLKIIKTFYAFGPFKYAGINYWDYPLTMDDIDNDHENTKKQEKTMPSSKYEQNYDNDGSYTIGGFTIHPFSMDDFDEDDKDEDDDTSESVKHKSDKKKKKDFYGTSRSWKNADNPKRDIKRHGVIIADKDDIKKDIKILKEFLNDFLPGDKDWQKEFRKELLHRWIDTLFINKKTLKKYEKDYRRKQYKKNAKNTTAKAVSFASQLFRPANSWSDPNK